MPAPPNHAKRMYPGKGTHSSAERAAKPRHPRRYAELRCKSNFSFLRGASHPDQLAQRAAELEYDALAITDRNTLAGIVRMHCAAKACSLPLIIGAEITPTDAPPVTLYVTDRAAYGHLCRIISQGRLRARKGECHATFDDIVQHNAGLLAIVHGDEIADEGTKGRSDGATEKRKGTGGHRDKETGGVEHLHHYRDVFGDRLYLSASIHGNSHDQRILAEIDALARKARIPMLATNDVHYHEPGRRFLQDVLTCIRHHCTLAEAGTRLFANAERHLKPIDEMERLFADYPDATVRSLEIADRCHFSLDELRYEYPEELCPPGYSLERYLAELTWAGAQERYPQGIPDKVTGAIEHELQLIRELAYEPYFLTVWDIVKFARSREILCQGRGSAANSAVCYCLGITSVDPDRIDLLFERFVSAERNEPPDIDVDFEHERREEVFQYIYNKYGREHAGIVAEVITYRARSAVRDVGKTLGLSLDRIDALAKKHEWWDKDAIPEPFLREIGFDPNDRTLRMLRKLVSQIYGFPRHLSQHVGGFVITRGPLCEMVPIENAAMPDRTFIEWDKDDIDALGMLKIDCLALGMLTAIRKCLNFINSDEATEPRSDEGDAWGKGTKKQVDTRAETRPSGSVERIRGTEATTGIYKEYIRCDSLGKVDQHPKNIGDQHDCKSISRSDRLATSDGTHQAHLSGNQRHARDGTVWIDNPNAQGSRVDPVQHCRGTWPRKPDGLSTVSQNGTRFTDGIANTDDTSSGPESHSHSQHLRRTTGGNRSRTPRVDSQPEKEFALTANSVSHSSSLRRFVAPSLPPTSLHTVPPEDPEVYEMICHADTVGVFQIESRAQMSMLPRLRPRYFYDLVIEVAIVRPGPIQGGMVHPYLRRRNGEESVTYPNDAIKGVLQRTLGVPLFQEQAMRLAVVAAGFTPGEADQLRRAMAAWQRGGDITRFREKLITGMRANGLSEEFAERCFKQICGFGEYGFPESHAASFALLVYVSAWLKRYYPAAFCASILNSQPMGFYLPAQLVRDAKEHGVCVLPVDVNFSGYDCRLEKNSDEATKRRNDGGIARDEETEGHRDTGAETRPSGNVEPDGDDPSTWGCGGPAVRLGMRLVKGISLSQVEGIESAQRDRSFTSMIDLAHRSGAARATLARLAAADAMRSLGLDRRQAVWDVLALDNDPPMLAGHEPSEPKAKLPVPSLADVVKADYEVLGLSLNAHPIGLVRKDLDQWNVETSAVLRDARQGHWVRVGGLVLVRQRPSTASGIVFCTLEDETGVANLVIRSRIYEKYRNTARGAVALVAEGRVEREGEVVHLQVYRLTDMSRLFDDIRSKSRDFH